MKSRVTEDFEDFNVPEGKVPIMETFTSIQGEGYHSGKAAFFIRFAGCDIGCQWCDTKDSWSTKKSTMTDIKTIVKKVNGSKTNIVVITGGEPLVYDIRQLTKEIKRTGKYIHLETSGAHPLKAEFDWLTLSSKKIQPPLKEYYQIASELKVVIENINDLDFAVQQAALVNKECKLLLQPVWDKQKEIIPIIINFLGNNPDWRFSSQLHKYLGLP